MIQPRLLRITTVPQSLTLLLEGQLTFFQQQGFEVLAVSADGSEVQQLTVQGIPHRVVNMTRSITPVKDLLALIRLIRIIKKFKPDIVHTHTPKAGLLGMIAAWMCRVPVRLHTVAGLPLMEALGWKRKLLVLTERITYACATRVYPNSKGLLEFIHSTFNIRYSKFSVIGNGSSNGIDSSFFNRTPAIEAAATEVKAKYAIQSTETVFCFIGRVVRDKGMVELVRAFQHIEQTLPARLLVVGPFEQDLDPLPQEVLHYLQTSDKVILAGFQKDIRPWLVASDALVFPSYREGFPNVVMQAACMEVPVIASDINGCNEIIQHQQTGVIVSVKDVSSLQNAMISLAMDSDMRKLFGKKSRDFVVTHFERQFVWRELQKEYTQLLASCLA